MNLSIDSSQNLKPNFPRLMPDLAIFLMDLDGGGAEKVMLNLAYGFAERGLQVDLILVKAEGPYLSNLPSTVRVVKLESSRLIQSLPALSRYLKQEQPPVLISALEDTNMVALWAKKLAAVSTHVVVSVHNNLSREAANATTLKRKLTPQLVKWFYPWANSIVAVSKGVADNLVQIGLPSNSIKVIYNPIVSPELSEKSQEVPEHPWFLPNQPPVILGVGRLEKQKDFSTLIRAFAQLKKQSPVRLMILGEGSERSKLQDLVNNAGLTDDVAFPGFVANPYAFMARATVLVLSSAWEGFGNVLVEAMAAGTPVVSTDCESGPTEILANGQYGKLVTVGDIEGMAKAIAQTIQKPLDGEVLKRRANEFSLEKALTQYETFLQ